MRLIDADVFKTEYENLITWVSHRAEKARLREFIKDIQHQPTVKAIPIEFVKRFATFFPPTPTYIYGEEIIDIDAWCEELLEHWEKENET